MTNLVRTTQVGMTTPRPKLTPVLTFLTLIAYVMICNVPILDDILIWQPMSTIVLANQAVMTTPRPKLTPDLTFLTSVTYVLICNMPILDDNQIWTHMTTQVVNTKQYWPLQDLSWPRIWHSWPQLPMLWYATCPYLMTNWFEHLWPPYYGPPKLSWPLQDLNLPLDLTFLTPNT